MEQKTGEEQQESPDMLQQQRELSFEEKVLMTTLSWQNRRKKISEKNAGAVTKSVSGQSCHGSQS